MSDLMQDFHYENQKVQTVLKGDKVYFVARDVCNAVGIGNITWAMSRIEEDEKMTLVLLKSSKMREVWLVNESGLYSLIFQSRKPKAKAFRKWVTSEVLPSIRKTGSYGTSADTPRLLKYLSRSRLTPRQVARYMELRGTLTQRELSKVFGIHRRAFYDLDVLLGLRKPSVAPLGVKSVAKSAANQISMEVCNV